MFQFKNVRGEFDCGVNNLTSLKGCPETVGGDFHCAYNKLTSLEHCPKSVKGNFYCIRNNLKSLKHVEFHNITGKLNCDDNLKDSHEYRLYEIYKKLSA